MARNKKNINLKKFFLKIVIPTLVSIILFIVLIFNYIIPYFEENLLQSKKEMIRELVNSTLSIANKNYTDFLNGKRSEAEAKADAIDKIQSLRYGAEQKDYFFITDLEPNMIAHPYRPDLNGRDLSNFKDPNGKRLFVEMVREVKLKGEGFVDYKWQWMDDSSKIVSKISYVKEFKPWGWVVGTGIYIEDVVATISAIENEMIIVSIVISFLVALLLTIIVYQHFRTEVKRARAESELLISKQKYKTLVEASTEGAAMTLDGELIYTNKIFDDLLPWFSERYKSKNLLGSLTTKKAADNEKIADFLIGNKTFFQLETELVSLNGGEVNVLLSFSKITLSEKQGLIITIRELSESNKTESERNKWARNLLELLEALNQVMFKIQASEGGKFIDVTSHAAQTLSFESSEELIGTNLLDISEDSSEALSLLRTIKEQGFVSDYRLRVRRSNGELAILSIDAKYSADTTAEAEYIIGVFSDVTEKAGQEELLKSTCGEFQGALLHLDRKLARFKKETISCNLNLSAKSAAQLMTRNNTDVLLIRSDAGDPIGIITDSDIRSRLFADDQDDKKAVYEIMSSPVYSLNEEARLSEALVKMEEKGIHHLFIKDVTDDITGIIGIRDIIENQYSASHLLVAGVKNANSLIDLKTVYSRLPIYVETAVEAGIKPEFVISTVSSFAKAMTKKLSELIILELGEPPAPFAFVSLGSEGRQEQTLVTDQDNAIIFDDVPEERFAEVERYFLRFAERLNYMLDAIGYSYCKGGVMAKNPKWNKPLAVWKKYFSEWIVNPEPQNLLEISIFFDMKTTLGAERFSEDLREHIRSTLAGNPAFFGFLARVGATYKTQLSFFGKIQTESIDEYSKSINVKDAIRVIVHLIRLYSMKHNLSETNTLRRLKALYEKNVFSEQFYRDIAFSYNFLTTLQLKTQVNAFARRSVPVNYVDLNSLSSLEVNLVKKVFSQIAVFQSKLKYDFGLSD